MVWKKGIELTRAVYELTRATRFPDNERYGLVSQLRRAAVSVPSNIAEGQARQSTKEFVQFLYVARGSLAELDTQFTISRDLNYVNDKQRETMAARIAELQRMTLSLIKKLQKR